MRGMTRALQTARGRQSCATSRSTEGGHYVPGGHYGRKPRYAILLPAVNQSLSIKRVGGHRSLPADRPVGPPPAGMSNSVITPSRVTRPSFPAFVNQTLRSGPTAMLMGDPFVLGIGYSVMAPSIVILPTRLPSG